MGRPLALQVLVRARRVRGDLLRDDVGPRPVRRLRGVLRHLRPGPQPGLVALCRLLRQLPRVQPPCLHGARLAQSRHAD